LILLIVARLAISVSYDEWLSHDEVAHLAYAGYVGSTDGDLPRFAASKMYGDVVGDDLRWYQTYQQPGFYYAAAPFALVGVKAARVFSLSFWIAGVMLLWAICRKWWMLLFLALPGSILVSSMITNQSLEFFGASLLAYAMHEESDWIAMVGAVVFCMAKVTGIAVCGGLAAWYVWKQSRHVFYLMPGLIIGLYAFFDRFGLFAVNSTALQDTYSILANFGHALTTGIIDPMQPMASWLGGVGLVVLAVGATLVIRNWKWLLHTERGVAVSVLAAIAVWFTVTHAFSEGRLLYAAVPFMVINGENAVI
jgi:hypothetical protein